MSDTARWDIETAPGWATSYRVVERYAWLPWVIEGRWRWRTRYYALEGMHPDESPPSFWITVERAMTPEPLVAHVAEARRAAFVRYRYGVQH